MEMKSPRLSVAIRCLVLAIFVTGTPPTLADGPKKARINGEIQRIGDARLIRVWGTDAQRGRAQGYLLARDIVDMFEGFMADTRLSGGPEKYEAALKRATFMMQIPAGYKAELRGMLAGIESRLGGPVTIKSLQRPLRFEDLLAINCVPDMARIGCSSFAAWGEKTVGGATISGRNLDWAASPALDGRQILIAHVLPEDSSRVSWVSVTWPGFIGCLTGMNAEGVTVSMHDVDAGPPTTMGPFTPRGFALRDAIESAHARSARADVRRILRSRICAVGNNVPVSWPAPLEKGAKGAKAKRPGAAVFEYDGRVETGGGVTVVDPEGDSLTCTNHYVKRAAATECDRYKSIEKILNGKRQVTIDLAWKILRNVERPQEGGSPSGITYHAVVFEPNAHRMHIAFARDRRPAPDCPAVTVEVDSFISGKMKSSDGEHPRVIQKAK